jgi:hypothetical protein
MMGQAVGSRSRIWSGLVLIALGVLFLLDHFGHLRFWDFLGMWWPTVLILIGVIQLIGSRGRGWGGPLLLICLGLLFQGERLHVFVWWRFQDLWPILLVAVGLGLLLSRLRSRPAVSGAPEDAAELVDAFVVFGGIQRAVTSPGFRGGDATALLGGIDLDLRRAGLASGQQSLNLSAIMGGIKVRVPEGWQVSIEGTPLMGAIEDRRRPAATGGSAPPASASEGRLVIRGFALMGGIEVTS